MDEVAFVRTNDQRVRVLGVRRLDHLDEGVALLGMTTEELHDSVVVLDQIEARSEPSFSPCSPAVAIRSATMRGDVSAARAIAVAAGEAIRRELAVALGTDAGSVTLATAQFTSSSPPRFVTTRRSTATITIASCRLPAALAEHVGEPASAFAVRSRYELSAYLGQIASDMWLPQLTLWNLSRHAFRGSTTRDRGSVRRRRRDRGARAPAPHRVAGPVFRNGAIDRDRLAALVAPIAERSTTELRAAAAKLWSELFEQRLVRIVDE